MQYRPTKSKLDEILDTALKAFQSGHYESVNNEKGRPYHLVRDISKLENYCEYDIDVAIYWEIVLECIEIASGNSLHYYKQPSDYICEMHEEIKGEHMWAFVVPHQHFTKNLYIKFCIKEDNYIHIDCHP